MRLCVSCQQARDLHLKQFAGIEATLLAATALTGFTRAQVRAPRAAPRSALLALSSSLAAARVRRRSVRSARREPHYDYEQV